ncbi:MAG TPA: hypothetical protein PKY30_08425 [Myxococcota bacterium]|nr:hypothetical protein [Myxococcota bacterium]
MILLLLACPGLEKTPEDSSETPIESTEASTILMGVPNQALGTAVAIGDYNGDGVGDLAASAYAGGPPCFFAGPPAEGKLPLSQGACYTPVDPYDFAGFSIATAGDTDGNGVEELAVGAIGASVTVGEAGAVYLVGATGGALAEAAVLLEGEVELDYAGSWVAGAGDVNGDQTADLLVGATGNDEGGPGGGKAYLLYGPISSGILGQTGASFVGAGQVAVRHATPGAGDGVGYALAGVGDTNGDGFDDVLVGAAGNDEGGMDAGKACLFLGPVTDGVHGLEQADGVLRGAAEAAYAGDRVGAAGDSNGDGNADLLISADGAGGQTGTVYLWEGPVEGEFSLADAPVAWTGEKEGDQAGYAMVGGQDLDADGQVDLAIGAWAFDGVGLDSGRTYLVFGPFARGTTELGAMAHFDAPSEGEYAGRSLAAGQVGGDSGAGVLIGAPFASQEGVIAGRAYLIQP